MKTDSQKLVDFYNAKRREEEEFLLRWNQQHKPFAERSFSLIKTGLFEIDGAVLLIEKPAKGQYDPRRAIVLDTWIVQALKERS